MNYLNSILYENVVGVLQAKSIESSTGYLEFSWLNLRKSDDSPIEKCSCMVCVDRFSEQDN